MDEIYLSWEDCVSTAYERYEWVLEQKKAGLLPKRKKDPSDLLVSMTAQRMGEQEKLRRIGKELFHDFRETAIGMMDNIQEAEETAERLFELSPEEFAKEFYNIFKR
jgi:precorrin-3B methylase